MNGNDYQRLANALQQIEEARVRDTNQIASEVNRLSQLHATSVSRQQLDAIKEIISHTYGKSQTYANFIMVGGYAAFFTMWVTVKPDLPKLVMLIAGLLMTVSAVLFVVAEVQKMINTGLHFRKIQEKLNVDPSANFIEEIQSIEKQFSEQQYKFWLILFYPSLICGVLAGSLLAGCFMYELIMELI